jgi:hypothetical protein
METMEPIKLAIYALKNEMSQAERQLENLFWKVPDKEERVEGGG